MSDLSKEIQAHWNSVGEEWGQDPKGAMPDRHLRELEFAAASKFVGISDTVLDLGCGNGTYTIELARKTDGLVVGVDYAPEMIRAANNALELEATSAKHRVKFINSDVLNFSSVDKFSRIFTFRCLINLTEEEHISSIIERISELLLPNGLALLSESTVQGFDALNKVRASLNMPPVRIRWHNTPVDEVYIEQLCKENGLVLDEVIDYSSTYYLISRCVNIKFSEMIGHDKEFFEEMDDIAMNIPNVGRYGLLRLFVIRKK